MLDKPGDYANPIIPEKSFWQYPKSSEDLQWHIFNSRDWVHHEIFQPGHSPNVRYETAFTHQHVIRVPWSPSAFEMDYFSPKHNLRAATKALMDAIMSSMKIELSAEAKKQFIEAGVDVP